MLLGGSRRASQRLTAPDAIARPSIRERHHEGRVELMQLPTQPLLRATPLVDEIVTVIRLRHQKKAKML